MINQRKISYLIQGNDKSLLIKRMTRYNTLKLYQCEIIYIQHIKHRHAHIHTHIYI